MDKETLARLVNVFRFVEWIKVIAITGGPCAGKSTFLKMAIKLLEGFGFKVIVVPEVARELIASGIFPWDLDWKHSSDFQKHNIFNILEKEASFFRALADMDLKGKKVIFLCDRGIPDGAAYLGEENFKVLLAQLGTTFADVLERYFGVVHLVTVADGKPELYQQDEERHETVEQAVEIDHLLRRVWHSHRHFALVDNSGPTFGDKINTALLALKRLIPMPNQPEEIEEKWYLTGFSLSDIPDGCKSYSIRQCYLNRPDKSGIECRVREKITDGVSTYYYTEKVKTEVEGVRGESEEPIDKTSFDELITLYSNPDWKLIEKTRYKVPYGTHLLEIDFFHGQLEGLVLAECEFKSVSEKDLFVLPEVSGEWTKVTADERFSNASLAKHGLPAVA